MKKYLSFLLVLVLGLVLVACTDDQGGPIAIGYKAPGINDDHIIVGNTAAVSGGFAVVGVPFNTAMLAVFDEYNAKAEANGERTIVFKHYDDEFDGDKGLTYTKKLVQEDHVFALVGHFGTNTVEATMDYLLETEIPMIYGVTGVNSLYFEPEDGGSNILSVQPIYRTEGQVLLARVLHENLFGPQKDTKLGENETIVVLYSDDDAGQSIKVGVQDGAVAEDVTARVLYLPFNAMTASATVTTALQQNPGAIILASNQAPATAAATALREQNSTVPLFSSYVNGNGVFIPAQNDGAPLPYDVYANAWVDIVEPGKAAPTAEMVGQGGILLGVNDDASLAAAVTNGIIDQATADYIMNVDRAAGLAALGGYSDDYWEFVKLMNESDREGARGLWANSYAMAGYVAAKTFVELLDRVDNFKELTWESFIALAESAPIDLPMAGLIDWDGGYRLGLTALALNKLTYPAGKPAEFVKVKELELLEDIRDK